VKATITTLIEEGYEAVKIHSSLRYIEICGEQLVQECRSEL
jgi:hypothetical protein